MKLKTVVYTSDKRTHFFKEIKAIFTDIRSSNFLAYQIAKRDIQAQYRQSVLGILWAFVTPMINAVVWIFLSASGAVAIPTDKLPYPLFVFIGTILWSVFTESLNMPLIQTQAAKGLISKINFPKEAILVAGFYKLLFNTSIKLIIVIIALFVFKVNPGINFLLGGVMIIFIMMFGVVFGMLITPIGMLYKDIGRGIPLALSFLMYTAPVVYQEIKNPMIAKIVNINPLTPLINSARNTLTGYGFEQLPYLLGILGVTLIIGLLGWIFYRVSIPIIVERM